MSIHNLWGQHHSCCQCKQSKHAKAWALEFSVVSEYVRRFALKLGLRTNDTNYNYYTRCLVRRNAYCEFCCPSFHWVERITVGSDLTLLPLSWGEEVDTWTLKFRNQYFFSVEAILNLTALVKYSGVKTVCFWHLRGRNACCLKNRLRNWDL